MKILAPEATVNTIEKLTTIARLLKVILDFGGEILVSSVYSGFQLRLRNLEWQEIYGLCGP